MRRHGPWQIVRSAEVYRDPWLAVRRDEVLRPDGKPGSYVVAHLKPGVSVLAVDEDDSAYLTEEFHYGVGRTTVEAVSGGVETGEDVLESAKRELREEVGLEAALWTDLGTVDPFTANVVSPTRLYLAERLRSVPRDPEGTEQICVVRVPFEEAVSMVNRSEITHGPSCVLILKAALLRAARKD
jgi:ADP-ribose pyrophosphatase